MNTDRNQSIGVRRVKAGEASAGQRLDNFLLRDSRACRAAGSTACCAAGRVNGKRKQADYRLAAEAKSGCRRCATATAESGTPHVPDALLAVVRDAIVHEDARPRAQQACRTLPSTADSGLAFGVIEAAGLAAGRDPRARASTGIRADACSSRASARRSSAHATPARRRGRKHYAASSSGAGGWAQDDRRLHRCSARAASASSRASRRQDCRVHLRSGRAFSQFRDAHGRRNQTGRTHQIRVHAAFAGHPVAGDEKYGNRESMRHCARSAFAACSCTPRPYRSAGQKTGRHFGGAPLPAELRSGAREAAAGVRSGLSRANGSGPRPGRPASQMSGSPTSAAGSRVCTDSKSAIQGPRSGIRPRSRRAGRSRRSGQFPRCQECEWTVVRSTCSATDSGSARSSTTAVWNTTAAAFRDQLCTAALGIAGFVEDALAAHSHPVEPITRARQMSLRDGHWPWRARVASARAAGVSSRRSASSIPGASTEKGGRGARESPGSWRLKRGKVSGHGARAQKQDCAMCSLTPGASSL